MHIRGALVLMFAMLPGIAVAQKADTGSIRYTFKTLVYFDPPAERSRTILKVDPWFSAKAVPARAVELQDSVAIPGTPAVIEKGAVLIVADSAYFAACSDKVVAKAGIVGTGRLPVCLIDMDRDGQFDAWYRSSVPLSLSRDAGHVQRDDIYPIKPVKGRELSPEELRKLPLIGVVSFQYVWGTLAWCKGYNECMTKQPAIKPGPTEQVVDYMGGQFAYREIDKKHLAVRLVRDPPEWTY